MGAYLVAQIDYMTAAYAVHRLSGIVTPANAVYTSAELAHQLRSSGSKALFTCPSLVNTAVEAAEIAGLQRRHIHLLPVAGEAVPQGNDLWTLEDMISNGSSLTPLPPLVFSKGQGAEQTAFLCYSSGTSGNPVSMSYCTHHAPTTERTDLVQESSNDLASQCDREYPANVRIRVQGPSRQACRVAGTSCPTSHEPHIRAGRCCSRRRVARGRLRRPAQA